MVILLLNWFVLAVLLRTVIGWKTAVEKWNDVFTRLRLAHLREELAQDLMEATT